MLCLPPSCVKVVTVTGQFSPLILKHLFSESLSYLSTVKQTNNISNIRAIGNLKNKISQIFD